MRVYKGPYKTGYVVNEALTFYSMYLCDIKTAHNRPKHHQGGKNTSESKTLSVFKRCTRLIGKGIAILLNDEARRKTQLYILNYCDEATSIRSKCANFNFYFSIIPRGLDDLPYIMFFL